MVKDVELALESGYPGELRYKVGQIASDTWIIVKLQSGPTQFWTEIRYPAAAGNTIN